LISTVVMFQDQNRETINSVRKAAVSFKIIMTTSVTRPCFATQHQTCKTKTDFLVSDWFLSFDHITDLGYAMSPTCSARGQPCRLPVQRGIVTTGGKVGHCG